MSIPQSSFRTYEIQEEGSEQWRRIYETSYEDAAKTYFLNVHDDEPETTFLRLYVRMAEVPEVVRAFDVTFHVVVEPAD